MPFRFTTLDLRGLVAVEPLAFDDERGTFMEVYRRDLFYEGGIPCTFVQDNCSVSSRGVLRGLHFQLPPHAQAKLVRVSAGRIWDVGVDIRRESPSFGQWFGAELSSDNRRMLFLPEGFAHGFLVLSDSARVEYKCSSEYDLESDAGVLWNDPDLSIDWPLPDPIVSAKDAGLPRLKELRVAF